MKSFHQILDITIEKNLEQFMNIAECLQIYLEKIPKEEILQHLKINREKMRSFFQSSFGLDYAKDMELIDRSIKKMEKGDFTLYQDLIEKKNDLKEFYMDPQERDKLENSPGGNGSGKDKTKKHKKIKKEPLKYTYSRNERLYNDDE